MLNPEIVPQDQGGVWSPGREPRAGTARDSAAGAGIEFERDGDLAALEWETVLFEFVRRYQLNFVKLELLLLFYRGSGGAIAARDIVERTGYHPAEVAGSLAQLVSQRLIRADRSTPDAAGFCRLDENEFIGRGLLQETLFKLVAAFKEREGRLRIIYALLKAREAQE